MSRALERCFNVADLRRAARRRLPKPVFDYLDGGADDERTLHRSSAAFADYEIVPDVLVDTARVKTATRLFAATWPGR